MQTKGLEYFLTAVLYCIWKQKMQFGRFLHKISTKCMEFVMKYLSSAKMRERMKRNSLNYESDYTRAFHDRKHGMHIMQAKTTMSCCCDAYYLFVPSAIFGLCARYAQTIEILTYLAISFIVYIPYGRFIDKKVFKDYAYLKYFKQFDKENKKWNRKWATITFLFIIGSILFFAIAVGLLTFILLFDNNGSLKLTKYNL